MRKIATFFVTPLPDDNQPQMVATLEAIHRNLFDVIQDIRIPAREIDPRDANTGDTLVYDGTCFAPSPTVTVDPPASASDTGTAGQLAYDSSYIYVCIATDTWKRVAISTW